VSLRTVYRDVRDLSLSGVPVEGEAGVGYRLRPGFDVPPSHVHGERNRGARGRGAHGRGLGRPGAREGARTAIEKIVAALPPERRLAVETTRLYAPSFHVDGLAMQRLEAVRDAIGARRVLRLDYRDSGGKPSERAVWPLALYYWGRTGRSARGASVARTFAISASIASRDSRRSSGGTRTRRASGSQISSGLQKRARGVPRAPRSSSRAPAT